MYLSILNILSTSPFCKLSNNVLSNLAPSGEYSYGPSSLNLCDKSPLAINTVVLFKFFALSFIAIPNLYKSISLSAAYVTWTIL